jgi:hypothetical protein
MKFLLFAQSYLLLVRIDLMMRRQCLQSIHSLVRNQPVNSTDAPKRQEVKAICSAVSLASAFYIKPVLCLQNSTATAVLLRRHGWRAELVIGAQMLPFRTHAWCEIDQVVVNDKPYMHDIYRELERC